VKPEQSTTGWPMLNWADWRETALFILSYNDARSSSDPRQTLLGFCQSTYDAAADLGNWDRAALECPLGVPRRPRQV
jgi:hypothetical protein